ncbi:hypothetical protein ABZW18_19720 [Streptomyces sp. NPDC004647]|uniref:hypothetical protein n=1 Tax=Streptomyces sp. NPDC004647 TaxID=3154671 RepID=UPI0033B60A73
MVHCPAEGLEMLEALESDGCLAGHHRLYVVRARLFEMAGDRQAAVENYRVAASRTTSLPERHYLSIRAAQLAAESAPASNGRAPRGKRAARASGPRKTPSRRPSSGAGPAVTYARAS